VRDGEGVHRIVTVRVSGAKTVADADAVARALRGLARDGLLELDEGGRARLPLR